MFCKKCGGRVMHDRMYNIVQASTKGKSEDKPKESSHVELSCVRCGKRWAIKKGSNAFVTWLEKKEKQRESGFGISS